jgi:hypothetical protein
VSLPTAAAYGKLANRDGYTLHPGAAGTLKSGNHDDLHACRAQGVISVTSPLDLLDDVNADEVRAAVEATRQLAGR